MLKGSFTALITPFKDGKIDEESFRSFIDFQIDKGIHGVVPVGTTGESPTLSHEEHKQAVEICIDQVNKRVPVIAGTGSNNTEEAIDLTHHAEKSGADAALIVTPYYNKPTQRGLYEHYKKIADEVSIPQILYNVPGRTSVDMLPDTVKDLSTHPNIIGIKEASGNLERSKEILEKCSDNLSIFTGDDKTSARDILMGFRGNISVTANVVPLEMHNMCRLASEGRESEAQKINTKIDILHDNLFIESNPIPVKWALNRMNLIKKGIRLPLTWLDEKYEKTLEDSLIKANIISKKQ